MVVKIKKGGLGIQHSVYKSSKAILTPQDIKKADKFDLELRKAVRKLEDVLLRKGALLKKGKKKDVLEVWYRTGKALNEFLERFPICREDENYFWNNLYGYSPLIHEGIPATRISRTRNDFRMASLLAKYPWTMVEKVGLWAIWREILSYKFMRDKRILEWVMDELVGKVKTRDEARLLLKSIATRLKRIDTHVLNKKELLAKLKEAKKSTGLEKRENLNEI